MRFQSILPKSNSMITNHGLNRGSNATNEWFTAGGHRGGLTTIRPKKTRQIHFDRFEGKLARCTIFDLSQAGS